MHTFSLISSTYFSMSTEASSVSARTRKDLRAYNQAIYLDTGDTMYQRIFVVASQCAM